MLLQSLLRPVLTPIMRGIFDQAQSVSAAWSPASLLFSAGEPGVMLPPLEDFSKLFQDTAGTVPVTSIGQPVGKVLDASGNGNHFTFTGVTIERDVEGCHYLALSSSTGVTPSIDLSTTNKVTYFLSHRKESASLSIPLELGGNSVGVVGTFGCYLNNAGANDSLVLRGSSSFEYPNVATGSAPVFNVLSNRLDLAAASQALRQRVRINGTPATLNEVGSDPGGGSFSNQLLNIGARSGGEYPFAGRLYGLIVRGADTSDTDTQLTDDWLLARGSNSARYTASVLALGDSTVSAYIGPAILSLIGAVTGTTSAVSGDGITAQKAVWQALSSGVKTGQDAVFIQVGLNDIGYTEATSSVIARLQDMVDTVLSDVPGACNVYISQMTPCKQRWIDLFGSTNGAIAQQQWVDINAAIAGNGATPITGVSGRITAHVDPMSDGSGNLNASYDSGDHIHPNTAGRQINANAWQAQLLADGLL